jgi:hypothetical protein
VFVGWLVECGSIIHLTVDGRILQQQTSAANTIAGEALTYLK